MFKKSLVSVDRHWLKNIFIFLFFSAPLPLVFVPVPISYKHIKKSCFYKGFLVNNIFSFFFYFFYNIICAIKFFKVSKIICIAPVAFWPLFKEIHFISRIIKTI